MLDLEVLRDAVARHGAVTRVVIASLRGSAPREVGAAMLVWNTGQSGTIGGGALEYDAARTARLMTVPASQSTHALGPDLGQCCGGSVTLVFERWDQARLAAATDEVFARTITGSAEMPLSVRRVLADARGQGQRPAPQLRDGWLIEPVYAPSRPLWIWGAGHVGRALVDTLSPLPEFDITWVDTGPERFPDAMPASVTALPAADPARLVVHAPADTDHLILTYSHALDLDLCHRMLGHGFGFCGLIGSKTKWARFRSRLSDLGHGPAEIARITCPIGDPALGKHPQAIAIGVAGQLVRRAMTTTDQDNKEMRA